MVKIGDLIEIPKGFQTSAIFGNIADASEAYGIVIDVGLRLNILVHNEVVTMFESAICPQNLYERLSADELFYIQSLYCRIIGQIIVSDII